MGGRKTPLCVVFTVVERGGAEKVTRVYEKMGIEFHYRLSGEGTASSDLLDILGIGTSERDVLISPTNRKSAENLVDMIHREGLSTAHTKGIMCVLPLTAASMKAANMLLSQTAVSEEEGSTMDKGIKQSMIMIAVDQGYTEAVMTTAKEAGARGGTVVRSHIMRSKEHESFGGPTFAGERELILIVASRGERNAIMERVDAVHGGAADAHAIMYSLPIEQTAHLN